VAGIVGEAVPIAIRQLGDLLDRDEEPAGKPLPRIAASRSERRQAITSSSCAATTDSVIA